MRRVYKKTIVILVVSLGLGACANSKRLPRVTNQYTYSLAVSQQGNAAASRIKQSLSSIAIPTPNNQTISSPLPPPKIVIADKKLVGEEAVTAANNEALRQPKSSGYINSVMTFDYLPGALYQVYCAPLRVTDIQLQNNEHIVSAGAGDTLRWQVSKTYSGVGVNRQEHLLVKPADEGLVNSLVVTTDQRTYHIMLYSTAQTYMAAIAWRYADSDGLLANLNDGQSPGLANNDGVNGLDINRLDFGYVVVLKHGPWPDWHPVMVFNDGSKTYIKFSAKMEEAPTLFVGNSTRTNQIVNYRVVGNYYVIDGVFTEAQLRSGQNKPTIVQITHKG